jgi:hypothetical protein
LRLWDSQIAHTNSPQCKRVHPLVIYRPFLQLLVEPESKVIFLTCRSMPAKDSFSEALLKIFDVDQDALRLVRQLTDYEISTTKDPDIIFRGNTVVTKSLDALMRLSGAVFRVAVLSPVLFGLCGEKNAKSMELDPSRIEKGDTVEKNLARLISVCSAVLDHIFRSVDDCPV